ncbi:FAD:protein FMN transferase [Aerococcus loyolae]|uniref:FAD:protein FMN transferase n=1 Tax=Aerococcus urinae TaxID=1376 RepID=A0A2I1L5E4_9LACT|nr:MULTISPECIES: FAD:protein FMN transferase [Aerococcus]MCY3067721.1 FAD:protein FMN transferase [Aerococcus mictus]MCY3080378.1 FAD:protein FMN transferase [Aerococcus mictus]MDK6728476.1 FAD:protein FMN transferase [Aerococcus urinae]MDK7910530.1 FAD:protein FMN transferase [Aerococcus urinae]MDK8610880.1 FAD:protein FMN transferase [Aerococcus urinae]
MEAVKLVELMGTVIEMKVGHPKAEALLEASEAKLRDYEYRFSANRDDSMLMRVNQAAGQAAVKVDEDLFDLIQLAKKVSLSTEGRFNLAIGPLVKLWHIGFSDAQVPSQEEIEDRLAIIDPHKVQLDPTTCKVYLEEPGMEIDLGAIAKGYFADQIVADWRRAGADYGLINLGGNVLVMGDAPNRENGFWRIGIQRPDAVRGEIMATVPVKNQSVVTSGIYERSFKQEGHSYHHILDSRTGYPIETDLASLTIIAPQSVFCEIWTTALFPLRAEEAVAAINDLKGVEGLAVTQDGKILVSQALA